MICRDVFQEACPCVRAELAECAYCSLLRGEAVCGCDWLGQCLYEQYKWHDRPFAQAPAGTVAAVRTFAAATGLVVKADVALAALPLGTTVSFPLPQLGRPVVAAVILGTYPDAGFVYLLLPIVCAADLLNGQTLALKPDGNALAGFQSLAAAHGKNITLIAAGAFTEALVPLAATLRRQGNRVDSPSSAGVPTTADIVVVAGPASEIKRAATKLPPSFQGKLVTLTTEGLSPQ
jgi:hypothetical protein